MLSRFARIAAVSLSRRKNVLIPKLPAFRPGSAFPVRTYLTDKDEPERDVLEGGDDEDDEDEGPDLRPDQIKVTYVFDDEKQEIYARFMLDPVKWDVKALSQHYGMSFERAQAIVYLMNERFELMKSYGLQVSIHPGEDKYAAEDMTDDELEDLLRGNEPFVYDGPYVEVTIPPVWKSLFDLHKVDQAKDLAELIEEYNKTTDVEDLKATMTVDELKTILQNLKDHEARMENIAAYEENMEEYLDLLWENGVNINFQEVRLITKKTRQFDKHYFPRTLHDEEIDREKAALIKRIEDNTRAKVERDVPYYHDRFQGDKFLKNLAEAKANNAEVAKDYSKASRWKIGFRDLGRLEHAKKHSKQKDDVSVPTIIRTRTGQ